MKLADGVAAYFESRFRYSYDTLGEAEKRFLNDTAGSPLELSQARVFRQWALLHTGEFTELRRNFDTLVRDARRRGDLFLETTLKRGSNAVSMADGDLEQAYEILEQVRWPTPEGGFHLQHWFEHKAYGELALYEGNAAKRIEEAREDFDRVAKSTFAHVQFVRCESRWLHGRLLVSASASGHGPGSALGRAARFARQLLGEHIGYATVWGLLLRAGVEHLRDERDRAIATLREAVEQAEANGMMFCAAAARLRGGKLLGGDEGTALVAAAEAWMSEQEIAAPDQMVEVAAPGLRP
jgi:hypothetical protein